MARRIEANPEVLERVAAQLESACSDLNGQESRLGGVCGELPEAWQGAGSGVVLSKAERLGREIGGTARTAGQIARSLRDLAARIRQLERELAAQQNQSNN